MKVHHAVTDGVGRRRAAPVFTDLEPDPADGASPSTAPARPPSARPAETPGFGLLGDGRRRRSVQARRDPGVRGRRMVPRVARSTAKLLAPPTRSLSPGDDGAGASTGASTSLDVPLEDLARAGRCGRRDA